MIKTRKNGTPPKLDMNVPRDLKQPPAGRKSVVEKGLPTSLENRRLGGTAATDAVKSDADSSVLLDNKANDQNERSVSAGSDKAHDSASSTFSRDLHLTQPGMERQAV
jgi:hypothetical protein